MKLICMVLLLFEIVEADQKEVGRKGEPLDP